MIDNIGMLPPGQYPAEVGVMELPVHRGRGQCLGHDGVEALIVTQGPSLRLAEATEDNGVVPLV